MAEFIARVSAGHVSGFVSLEADDITDTQQAALGMRAVALVEDAMRSDEVRAWFGLMEREADDVPDTVAGAETDRGDGETGGGALD